MTIEPFMAGLALAAAVGLPPGVVMAETVRRGIRGGFGGAFAVQVGSLLGDLIYAILGLTGAALALSAGPLQVVVGALGVALMMAFGLFGLRDALRERPVETAVERTIAGALAAGASLSLTNPWVIVFWLGFGTAASGSVPGAGLDGLAVILAGYLGGLLAVAVALSAAVAITRDRLDPRVLRVLGAAASIAILVLAAVFAVRVIDLARAV